MLLFSVSIGGAIDAAEFPGGVLGVTYPFLRASIYSKASLKYQTIPIFDTQSVLFLVKDIHTNHTTLLLL